MLEDSLKSTECPSAPDAVQNPLMPSPEQQACTCASARISTEASALMNTHQCALENDGISGRHFIAKKRPERNASSLAFCSKHTTRGTQLQPRRRVCLQRP